MNALTNSNIVLTQESNFCDPSIEQCEAPEPAADPSIVPYLAMIPIVFWQIMSPNLSYVITNDDSSPMLGILIELNENIGVWAPVYVSLILAMVVHLPLGLFGLSFLDELMVLVLHWCVPLLTFAWSLFSTSIYTKLALTEPNVVKLYWAIQTAQTLLFNNLTYKTLPDAIRYIKPEWNFVEPGQPLLPAFFYIPRLFEKGVVEDAEADAEAEAEANIITTM